MIGKNDALHRYWNTPAPLSLDIITASPDSNAGSRLYAIEIGKVEGLTFIFYKGEIAAIHIHNPTQSSALSTYHRLSSGAQSKGVWVHVPLSKEDRLFRFAIREYFRGGRVVLLGTAKAGDMIFGRPGHTAGPTRGIDSHTPLSLVYGDPKDDNSVVAFFGAFHKGQMNRAENDFFHHAQWPPRIRRATPVERKMLRDPYYSSAPLAGVVKATVFLADAKYPYCRGIMFTYANGSRRTVGECRVCVDTCQTLDCADGLCF